MDWRDWAVSCYLCRLPEADQPGIWSVDFAGRVVRQSLDSFLTPEERADEDLQRYKPVVPAITSKQRRKARQKARQEFKDLYTEAGFREVCRREAEFIAAVFPKYGHHIIRRARKLFACL